MYESKQELAAQLAKLLSDVVTAKFIFQGYHWNVLGPDFGEYHNFFGMLYEDLDSSIDPLAENILKVGFPAPYLLSDYAEMSEIKEQRLDGTSPKFLLDSALRVNDQLINCYNNTFAKAEECSEQGLMDFLAGRIDMHKKWGWQIRAYLGVR
jgi:starvation-inducible DNA-binding protein